MNTYKIQNTTNLLGKRDSKFNSTLTIEYVSNRITKHIKINAGDTIFLTIQTLPLSVRKLKLKDMVIVDIVKNPESYKKKEIKLPPIKKELKVVKEVVDKKKTTKQVNKQAVKELHKK